MSSTDNPLEEDSLDDSSSESSGELPSAKDVDALLNSEMCQLSLDERNKVYQDIHGVSDEINETPDLVAKSHRQLDLEIEQIKEKTNNNYLENSPN